MSRTFGLTGDTQYHITHNLLTIAIVVLISIDISRHRLGSGEVLCNCAKSAKLCPEARLRIQMRGENAGRVGQGLQAYHASCMQRMATTSRDNEQL